jgi:hypothetical protein
MRQAPGSEQVPVNVCGSSIFGRFPKISSERTYNLYLSDEWLINTAGYRKILEISPLGEGRGIFNSIRGGFMIVVVNATVYSISSVLAITTIGPLATSRGEVFIDENLNSQICIVDGVSAYIYNYSLGFPNLTTQTTTPLIPNYVVYHNTYFLFGNANNTGTGSPWYAYSYATPTTISTTASNTFALQTKPDYPIAVTRLPAQSSNVLVFGTSVCEVFTNVGGLQNYRRNNTNNIDYGCVSVRTIATSDKYVAWLAANENNAPIILVFTETGYQPISTDGIDYLLSNVNFPAQSTAMFVRKDGHLFYQLTFYNPADNLTLTYDFTTQKFFDLTDHYENYHPARNYVYFNGNTYFISLNNGSLYQDSSNFTTYNESIGSVDPLQDYVIPRARVTNTVRLPDTASFIANSLVLMIDQGNDLGYIGSPEPISNAMAVTYVPRVDLTISQDEGITWSNTASRNLNPVGYRRNQMTWERMGQSNSLTFKFRFWSTSSVIVNSCVLDIYP